ncbi:TPA: nucleotidyltransferase domain-containing protein [bacterium]|nr:nucleotidyltransferase domain-containing protein [bacterium]
MPETKIIKSEISNILKELLQEKGINVQKIIIFGSYAKGTQREDSDIDVIIVSKDFKDKSIFERVEQTTGIGRELVRKIKKPFDLLFYSDDEWNGSRSLMINMAKESGEVIYG